jgi:FtsZ-interacting cell division protein ZipA
MDPENLRWTLLFIGTVLIVAVYNFGRHQSKLRNRAAIKTYTQEELEDPYIDDDTLRRELEHIDHVLTDDNEVAIFQEININPGIEAEYSNDIEEQTFIQKNCETEKHLVSYLLKKINGAQLIRTDVHKVLIDNGFMTKNKKNYLFFDSQHELFSVALKPSNKMPLTHLSTICFIMDRVIHRKNANKSYEVMLKVIDKLTQELDVKVYNQNQSLLSIDDISIIRKKLLNFKCLTTKI